MNREEELELELHKAERYINQLKREITALEHLYGTRKNALSELDKKDKVIDLMAGDLFLKDDLCEYDANCIEDIKKYFYKEVEEENELR